MSHSKNEKICIKCKSAAYGIFKNSIQRKKPVSADDAEDAAAALEDVGDPELLEKPPRFLTPYIAFLKSSWTEYSAAHPDSHLDSDSFKEFTREFAGKWKEMTEEEKAPFEEQSVVEKAAYQEQMVAYVAQQLEMQEESVRKGPFSNYLMFVLEEREKVRQEMGPEAKVVEVAKELGRRWTALLPELKEEYQTKASQAREDYAQFAQLAGFSDKEGSSAGAESDEESDTDTSSFYSFYSSSGEDSYSYSYSYSEDDDY